MNITKTINSEQIKTELLTLARSVARGSINPHVAASATGGYRAVFQLMKLELKEKELTSAKTRISRKKARK